MALVESALAWVIANKTLFYSLILCYLFYLALKLATQYHAKHKSTYLLGATVVLLGAFDMWSRIHESQIKAFFEQFRFLLVLIPLGVFLIFSILEDKRKKAVEERQKLRGAFSQYVSPSLVDEITKHPEKLKLGGEKKALTVFFSDIRGFTTLSEKLSPEELVAFLNDYLTAMTNIVLDNKGLIDKYIGDAIMAFWGAPIDDKDHATRACNTAVLMKKEMDRISADFRKMGRPEIKIGMGVNTGDMVVGNMGSDKRFDYTVIGDNVNLASRLEGLTKQYHVGIIITETTKDFIEGRGFAVRELDKVAVKGKSKPIRIFELVGLAKDVNPQQQRGLALFELGLRAYYTQQWVKARASFTEAVAVHHDETAQIFLDRIQEFEKHPLAKDWDGVFVATSK